MNVHHRLEGRQDAPVVVLSNSIGATLAMWDAQVPALARHFRVLRYDHRGHGASPSPPGPYAMADLAGDVVDLLDRLGIERASVCGLSMGGMVAQWLGVHAPERVDRLVLCSTSADVGAPEKWETRAATVLDGGIEAIADAVLGVWFTAAFQRDEGTARFREMMVSSSNEGYAGCCAAIGGFSITERLGDIGAPTLVVAGAEDQAIPPEHGRRLQEGIPGAELALIDDAAHFANVEQPEAFTSRTLDHLRGAR